MKKLLVSLALLAVLSITLSACDVPVSSDAAQVNGAAIAQSELNTTLHAATSSSLFNCLLSQSIPSKGAGVASTYSSGFTAEQLSLLVDQLVVTNELAKLHLQSTPIANTIVQEQVTSGLSSPSGSSCTSTGAQVLASLPSSYQNLIESSQRDQDLLSAYLAKTSLTDAGVAAFSKIHPKLTELACVSAIVVTSKSTAESIEKQLKAGGSFSSLADSKSADTSTGSGGALGCVYPGEFSSGLGSVVASLAPNTPSAPVSFSSDWVILEVTKYEKGTTDGAAVAVVTSEQAAESRFVDSLAKSDHVWINSQYGHWGTSSGQEQVIPPSGPLNLNLTNAKSLTPVGAVYK